MPNSFTTKLIVTAQTITLGVAIMLGTMHSSDALAQSKKGKTGLPLPRFVSLKSGQANMRIGPGKDYQVSWLYTKPGYPLEIVEEYDNWRKVRDPEGVEGWVFHSLLSGRRTAIVSPWNKDNPRRMVGLHNSASPTSQENAYMEPGVIVEVSSCEESWCHVDVKAPDNSKIDGYIMQDKLWGVYPDETFDN